MTNSIPQAAVEAAAEGIYERAFRQELPEAPIDLARAALEAAMPEIRKQIVSDIKNLGYNRAQTLELLRLGFSMDYINGYERAITDATRIAGGENKWLTEVD